MSKLINVQNKVHTVIIAIVVILISFLFWFGFNSIETQEVVALVTASERAWQSSAELIQNNNLNTPKQILEIMVSYDANIDSMFQFGELKRKQGYVPQHVNFEDSYKIELIDGNGMIIESTPFLVPEESEGPPPLDEEMELTREYTKSGQINFIITVGWSSNAMKARIISPEGLELSQIDLIDVPLVRNFPNFQSISGKDFTNSYNEIQNISEETIDSQVNTQNAVNVVFIGNNFSQSQLNVFQTDVERFIEHLFTYEPYKSRATQFMFHTIENTTDLGCYYNGRLIICDKTKVVQRVNNSGAPYDKIVVIENNSEYGGSSTYTGACCAVTYNGSQGPEVFVHEFSHIMGNLYDEYVPYNYDASITNTVERNCYKGTPPANEWSGIVAPGDYAIGCKYLNWYSSSHQSIMRDLSYKYFNTPSQILLNEQIDIFAGEFIDTINPTTTITSPSDNSNVTGIATVETTNIDNNGVSRAELWIDNTLFQTRYLYPFSFSLDTSLIISGTHNIYVKAFDVAGNSGQSNTITINTPIQENSSPTIIIKKPKNNTKVPKTGSLVIATSATDVDGIKNIRIFFDGIQLKSCNSSSCRVSKKVNKISKGTHVIEVRASDKKGNVANKSVIVFK
jgi:hypothetical protein